MLSSIRKTRHLMFTSCDLSEPINPRRGEEEVPTGLASGSLSFDFNYPVRAIITNTVLHLKQRHYGGPTATVLSARILIYGEIDTLFGRNKRRLVCRELKN